MEMDSFVFFCPPCLHEDAWLASFRVILLLILQPVFMRESAAGLSALLGEPAGGVTQGGPQKGLASRPTRYSSFGRGDFLGRRNN